MNLNIFGAFASMTKEELEKEMLRLSRTFTEHESSAFEKGKELINEGVRFDSNDSGDKVFQAIIAYYLIKYRELNSIK